MSRRRVIRVVTGGQSGADRAATDVAIEFGVPYGGWVPRDGWAEDFVDPPGLLGAYSGFQASRSDDPAVRTGCNVADADATLLFWPTGVDSPGSELTRQLAHDAGNLAGIVDPFAGSAVAELTAVAARLPVSCTLNVAGPRASEAPGVYDAVRAVLHGCARELFGDS